MIVKLNDPEYWSQFNQDGTEEETDVSLLPKDTYAAPYKEPLSYGEEASRGLARGFDQVQALGYGTVGLAGDVVGSDAVRDFGLRGYERNMEEAAQNMGTVAGFTDIEDADDFVRWSVGTLAEFSPQLLTSIATGGIGATIGRRAVSGAVKEFVERKTAERVAGGMTADLAKKAAQLEAAQQITSRAMKTGIGLAGAATGVGQMTGSIYGDTQDAELAIKYGVPAGLIEGIYDRVIGGKLIDTAFGQQGKRGLVKGALGAGALGAVIEGPGEEVPQTYLEQMAKAEADPNYDINSPEARKQLIDAGAAGFLAGGAVAGTVGTVSELAPLTQRALRDRELPTLSRTMLGETENEGEPQPTSPPPIEFLDAESTPIVDDRLGSLQAKRFRLSGDDKVYWSVNNPSEEMKPYLFDLKPYTGSDEWMILNNEFGVALQQLAANGGRKAGAPGTQKWDTVSKFTNFEGVADPLSKKEQRVSAMVEDPNADVIKDLNIGKFDPRFDPTTEPRPLADAAADKDEFVLDGVRGYLAKDETGKTVFKSSEDGQEVVLPKNVEDAIQDDSFDANELSSLLDEETAQRFQYSPKPVSIKGTQRIQKAIDAVSAFEGATDESQKLAALQSLSAADLAAAKDQIARGELLAEQAPDGSAKTRELGFYSKLKNSLAPFEQAKTDAVNAGAISEVEEARPPEGESSDLSKGPPIQLTEAEAEYIGWNQEKGIFEIRQDFATNFQEDDTGQGNFLRGVQELVDQKNARIGKKSDSTPMLEEIKQQIEQGTKLAADLTALEQLEGGAVTSQQQVENDQETLELEKAKIKQRMREVGGPLVRVIYNDPQSGRKFYGALVADERGNAQDQEGKFRFRPYGSTFAGDADLRLSPEAVSASIEMDALGSMEENLKSYIGDRADTRNTSLLDNMLIAGRLLQEERRAKEAEVENAIRNRSDDEVREEVGGYATGEKISFVLPGVAQDLTSQDFVTPDGTIYRPLNVGEFKGKTAAANTRTQPNAEGKMVPVPMGTKDEVELGALKGLKDKETFRAQIAAELGIPPEKVTDNEIKKRIVNVERPIYEQGFNAGRSGNRALPPNMRSNVWMLGYEAGRNEQEKNSSWIDQDIQKLEKRVDDTRNDGILFDRFYIKIGNPNEKPPKAGKNRKMPKQVGILDQLVKGSEIGAYAEGREGEVILKSNWNYVSRVPKKESYFAIQDKNDPQPFINQFESIGSGRVGTSRRIMTGQGNIQVLVQDAELTEEEQIITAVLQQTGVKTAPRNEIYSRLAELGFKVAPMDKPAIFDLGAGKLAEQESFSFVDDIYGIKVPVTVGLFSNKQNSDAFFAKTHVQLDGAFEPLKKAFEAARRYERAKASKARTAAAGIKSAAIDKLKAEQDLRRAVLAAMDKGYDVRVRAAETTEEGKKSIGAEFEEYLEDLGISVSPDRGHFLVTGVYYNPTPQGSVENYLVRNDKSAELFQRSVRRPGQSQQEAAQTLKTATVQKGRGASVNTKFGLGSAERILTNWTAKNLEIQQRRKELSRMQAGRGKGATARAAAQTRGFNAFGERLYGILFDKARRHIENAPADDEVKTLWLDEVKAAIGKQIRVAQRSMLSDSLREKLQTRLNKIEARWELIKPEKGVVKSRKTETWGQSTPDPTQTQAGYRRSLQIWQDEKDEALAQEETDYLKEILPRLKGARVGVIETRAYDSALKAVKEEMIARQMQKPRVPTVAEIEAALAQDEKIVKLRERLGAAGISKSKANDLRKQIDTRSKKVIADFTATTTTFRKDAEAAVEELLNQTELPVQWRNTVASTRGYKELFDYLGLVKLQGENQWGLNKAEGSYSVASEVEPEVLYRVIEFAQNQLFRFTPEQEKIASALEAIFQGRLEEVQTQYGEKTLELLDKYKKVGKDRAKVKKFRGSRKDKEEVVLGKGESEKLSDEAINELEAENFARLMEFGLDQLTPGQQREVQEILDQYGEKEASEARIRFLQENEQNFKGEDRIYSKAELSQMQKDAEKALRSSDESESASLPAFAAEELLMALIADANAKIAAENKKSTASAEKQSKLSEVDKGVLQAYAKALEAVYSTNLFGRRQGRKVPPGLVWQAGSRASKTVRALREQNESLDGPRGQMPLETEPTWGNSRVEASEAIDDLVYDSVLRWLKTESGGQGRPGQEAAAGVLIPKDIRLKADEAFNNIKQLINITQEEQAEIDRLWDQNLTKDSQALENRLLDEKSEKFRDLMFFMGARSGGTTAQRRRGRELMRQVLPSFEGGNLKTELPGDGGIAKREKSSAKEKKKEEPPTVTEQTPVSQYALDLMKRKGIASTAVTREPNTGESIKVATPQPGNIPVDAAQSKAARAKFVQQYGMLSDAEMLKLTDEEIDRAYAAASSRASAEGAAMAIDSVIQATPSMDTLLSMSEQDLISGYIEQEKAVRQAGGRINPVEAALTGKTASGMAAEQQLNFSTLLKARAFGNYETFLRHVANDTNIPRAQRLIAKQYLDAQKSGFKWRDVAMQVASFATANNRKAPWAGLVGLSPDTRGGMAVYINTDAVHDGGPVQTMLHEADHILSFANVNAEQFGIKLNETQANARESLRQKWNEALLKAGEKLVADGVIDGKQVQSMSAEQKRDFFSSEIRKLVNTDGKYRSYNGVTDLAEFVTEAKVSNEFRSLLDELGFNTPTKGDQKFRLGAWLKDLFRSVAELVTGRRIDPSSELAKIYADSWELSGDRNFAVQPTQLAKSLGIDSANLGVKKSQAPATGEPESVNLKSGNKTYRLELVEEGGKFFVRTQWGSEGRAPQSKETPRRTYQQAKTYFDKKLVEKTEKRGYTRTDEPPDDRGGGGPAPTAPTPPRGPGGGRWLSDDEYRRQRAIDYLRRRYQGSWDYLSYQEKEREIQDLLRRDSDRGYYQRADYPAMSPAASPDRGAVAVRRFNQLTADLQGRDLTQADLDAWKQANPEKYAELEKMREDAIKSSARSDGQKVFGPLWHISGEKGLSGNKFDPNKIGSQTDSGYLARGFYFAGSEDAAKNSVGLQTSRSGKAYKIFVGFKNPLEATLQSNSAGNWRYNEANKSVIEELAKIVTPQKWNEFLTSNNYSAEDLRELGLRPPSEIKNRDLSFYNFSLNAYNELFNFLGIDGIVTKLKDGTPFEVVGLSPVKTPVFDPAQIKSAEPLNLENGRLVPPTEWAQPENPSIIMSPAASPDRGLVSRLVSGGAKDVVTFTGDRVRVGGWFDSEKGAPQGVDEFYTKSIAVRKAAERKIESLASILSSRLRGAQDIPLETVQTALGSIENPLTPEQAKEIRELEKDGMQQEADELRVEYRAQNTDNFKRRQQGAMNQLPKNIAEIVGEMREHIDTLGQQTKTTEGIESGVAVTIDANKGVYLNRSYLVFQDEATAEKHRKAVRNNPRLMADASDFVRRRLLDEKADAAVRRAFRKDGVIITPDDVKSNITVSDDEIARGIERLLNVNEQGFGRIIMAGRIPGQKTGETLRIFDQRGNVDEVVQKLWGVIDDPVTNYVNTALKMSAFLANDQFLAELKSAGTENGLLYDPLNPSNLGEADRATYEAALEAALDENPNLIEQTRFNKPKFRAALAKQNPELLSIFEEAERNVPQGYVKLSGENNKSLAPVSGMFAQADLAKWLFEKYPPGGSEAQNYVYRALGVLTMMPMAMKTVGSVVGQVRNFMSGGLFLVAGDNFKFLDPEWRQDSIEGLRLTFGDAWFGLDKAGNRKELTARLEELGKLGVINQSVTGNLVNDTLQLRQATLALDPSEGEKAMLQILGQRAVRAGRRTVNLFVDSYGASDDLIKIVTYASELGKYRRAMPGMSEQQLKEKAARIARDIHPTYSDTYAFTKGLKRQPFIAPFISFTSEVIRTSVNLVKLTRAEFREARETGNEELSKIARGRVRGMATAALGPAILSYSVAALAGVSGDDEEDLRRFLPDWQKNNQLLIYGKSNGKLKFWDISFTDPYSYLKTPIVAGMGAIFNQDEATAGERIKNMVVSSLGEVFAPWAGEQLFAGAIMDIARNKDASGREIVNWQDSGSSIAAGLTEHIWKTFSPGTVDTVYRVIQGYKGTVGETGRAYDFWSEMTAFTGTRPRETDVRQALGFKANQFTREYRDASAIFTGELLSRGTRAPGEIAEAYRRANGSTGDLVRGFGELVKAGRRLGLTQPEIRAILKRENISDEMVNSIFSGKFKYQPSKQSMRAAVKMGNASRVKEAEAAMK